MAEKEGKNINTALKGVLGDNDTLIGLVDGNVKQIETDVEGGLITFDNGVSKSDINVEGGVTGFNPIGQVAEGDKRAVSGSKVFRSISESAGFFGSKLTNVLELGGLSVSGDILTNKDRVVTPMFLDCKDIAYVFSENKNIEVSFFSFNKSDKSFIDRKVFKLGRPINNPFFNENVFLKISFRIIGSVITDKNTVLDNVLFNTNLSPYGVNSYSTFKKSNVTTSGSITFNPGARIMMSDVLSSKEIKSIINSDLNNYKLIIFEYESKESSTSSRVVSFGDVEVFSYRPINSIFFRIGFEKRDKTKTDEFECPIYMDFTNKGYLGNYIVNIERGAIEIANGQTLNFSKMEDREKWYFNYIRSSKYLFIQNSNYFRVVNYKSNFIYRVVFFDKDLSFISLFQNTSDKFYKPKGACYMKFSIIKQGVGVFAENEVEDIVLECDNFLDLRDVKNTKRPDGKDINILTRVYPTGQQRNVNESESNGSYYKEGDFFTNGLIRLPPNYNPIGEPVPLICFAHSSSPASVLEFSPNHSHFIDYLCNSGYAVWDSFSWSSQYPTGWQFTGCPNNIACYESVYKFIQKNFNVKKETFLYGKSHGGYQCFSLPYTSNIPILAVAGFAVNIDILNAYFGYHNYDRQPTTEDFCFKGDWEVISTSNPKWTQAAVDYFKLNKLNIVGYNPMWCGATELNWAQWIDGGRPNYSGINYVVNYQPCAFKVWQAPDDTATLINEILCRQRAVHAGGGIFDLRLMPSGLDNPHQAVDVLAPKVNITTNLGIEMTDIAVNYVEMLMWFRQFEI